MGPPPPLQTIDWATLGLTVTDTVNGHVESTFHTTKGKWSTPTLIHDSYLRVHGLSPGLNYGMQAYEGLKAARTTSGQICIFRPSFHSSRLRHSAETVSLPPVPDEVFFSCIDLAVRENAEFVGPAETSAVLYIRPVLFASGPQLSLEPPEAFTFAVYVQPATTYHGSTPLPALVMEDFDRAATRGVGHAKVGGNYAPGMKWAKIAKKKGFYLTLHLDSATMSEVEEFGTSAFIGVRPQEGGKGALVVPKSNAVIDSVTSDTLQTLAEELGYTLERRTVKYTELAGFSEVLAVGTAASILPVATIARESSGDHFVYCPQGKPGPVAVELNQAIANVIRGRDGNVHDWLHEVSFPN